ncbi:TfoX/Sxy family protein [bacterium]|nr:TfoX/Sxy family protein [bacterium]
MAYDQELAVRIRGVLDNKKIRFEEKEMMGGACYLVKKKMCVGIIKDDLMVRLDPDMYAEALTRKGCREMNFTGKPMKGYVFVEPAGMKTDKELGSWIQLALDFNPKAKASKKKKKKAK